MLNTIHQSIFCAAVQLQFIAILLVQAVPRALRSFKRTLKFFGLYVSTAPLAMNGCPPTALVGKDHQSDKEAANFLNPRYLQDSKHDDLGMHLLQHLASMIVQAAASVRWLLMVFECFFS